jgi:protein phosphatase
VTLRIESSSLTDVGRRRKNNEDSFLVNEELGLFVVADGMGGHAGGEIASAEACDQVFAMVKRGAAAIAALRAKDTEETRAAARRVVEAAIQAATYMIFGIADQDPARKGMGTTLSCLLYVGPVVVVGQVGDSRVYLVRDGQPIQITEDHTLIQMHLKSGAITAEQAKTATYGNVITRAVGINDYVEVDTFALEAKAGDRFVLCSDGVHGYLETPEELLGLCHGRTRDDCVKALVTHALVRGGKDNATALVVDVVDG